MESYLMMLYVTLEQESALKNLFLDQGWMFCKPDLSITTDKLGPSVSSVQTGKSSVMFENKPRKSGKRRRDAIQNKPPLVNLSKNIPNPLPVPTNVDQHNEQTFSGFLIETENISKIGELIEGGLQEGVPDMPKNSDSKVKLETTDLNYNNDASDDSEYDVKVSDEDTDVDYSYEEIEGEIANAAKETRAEKSEKDFDVSKEDDLQQKEAKILKTRDASTMVDSEVELMCITCQHFEKQAMIIDKGPGIPDKETGEPSTYICDICGKQFIHQTTYKRHVRSHEIATCEQTKREKKWKCNECKKAFESEGNLTEHVQHVHLKKPGKFMCHLCPKSFTRSTRLEGHLNSHFAIKPYSCKSCQMTYYAKSTLIEHQKKCEGGVIVRYKCHLCSAKFRSQKEIKTHRSVEHGNMFYNAPCGRKIKWKSSLKKHTTTCSKCKDIDNANTIIAGI